MQCLYLVFSSRQGFQLPWCSSRARNWRRHSNAIRTPPWTECSATGVQCHRISQACPERQPERHCQELSFLQSCDLAEGCLISDCLLFKSDCSSDPSWSDSDRSISVLLPWQKSDTSEGGIRQTIYSCSCFDTLQFIVQKDFYFGEIFLSK